MALYALDDLDDAIDVTKRFLLPFDLRQWAKLALVTFFVGVPGANVFQFNASGGGTAPGTPDGGPLLPGQDFVVSEWVLALAIALVVAAVVVGLLFLLVSSIMEFVLVESLKSERVTIRRYWSRRWRQGLRLFGFRLVLGLLLFGPLAVVGALVALPLLLTGTPVVSVVALLLFLPVFFLLALVVGLVGGFTTAFVVPIIILEDCGVLAGWRRLWPTVRSQWKQYGAYAVMAFVLSIAAGILVGIAMAAVAVALLIPFGLLGGIAWVALLPAGSPVVALSAASPVAVAVFAVLGVAFVLALLTGFAFVGVPVVAYLRYYALLVLGDTNESFDLVPDQRAAVRGSPPG